MAPPENRSPEQLVLACALALGAALMATGLHRGWMSDEVALVQPWSVARIYWDPESGANPPLHRLVMNIVFPRDAVLYWGRWLSLASTVGALAIAFALGRRVGRRASTGFIALALLAINPMVVEHATLARSYALWLLVGAWHAYALFRFHEEMRAATRVSVSLAASAFLLPWIHYLSIPMLLVEAGLLAVLVRERARRYLLLIVAPALVAALPLLPVMLGDSSRRLPGDWGRLASVGFSSLSAGWPLAAFVVSPWLVLWLTVDRPLAAERRALLAGLLGAIATTVAATPVALVRTSTAIFVVPFLVPLLASPPRRAKWFTCATVGAWAVIAAVGVVGVVRQRGGDPRDGVKAFAKLHARYARIQSGRPIYVAPSYQVPALYYTLEQRSIAEAPRGHCPRDAMCFDSQGTSYVGIDPLPERFHGMLVTFDRAPSDKLTKRCKPIEQRPYMHVFDCP